MQVIWTVARVALLPLVALLFFASTIAGAIRYYTPVPQNDSWDGYLHLYILTSHGDWQRWLGFSNEHRIILSRLLFWMDLRYFGGLSLFLSPVHVVLLITVWVQLCFAAWTLLRGQKQLAAIACAALALPCFSWLQRENLTWTYQSQFYFAYILPLGAFQCFAISTQPGRWRGWFGCSVCLGCMSAMSMANGVFALPLLIAMTLLSGHRIRTRLAVLLPVTAIVWLLYFHDFPVTTKAGASAVDSVKFGLAFLGGPAERLTGGMMEEGNMTLAVVTGAVVICGALAAIVAWRRRFREEPMGLALLAILAYVGIAASSVAVRRAGFGMRTAVSERYETAVLIGWNAIAILLVAARRDRPWIQPATLVFALLSAVALTPRQLKTLDPWGPDHARRMLIGALAVDLDLKDIETSKMLYPNDGLYQIAAKAKQSNLSVFGMPVMIRARESMGRSVESLGLVACDGAFDRRLPLARDAGAFRIRGWAFNRARATTPSEVYFANPAGIVIGVGLAGEERKDVARAVGDERAVDSGFEGFVRAGNDVPIKLYLHTD